MKITVLSSPHNPRLKALLAIKKEPLRDAFLIEGPNLLEAALSCPAVIKAVFFTSVFGNKPKGKTLLRALARKGAALYEIPEGLARKLSETEAPPGVLAEISYAEAPLESLVFKGPALVVASDAIKEPGNLGAIIRTADAAGADAVVVLPGSCSPLNPKALRATAGSFFNIPVVEADLKTLLRWKNENGVRLLGMDVRAGQSVYEADLKVPVAMVFGEEAHGMRPETRAACDGLLKIPIRGKAESLNVAASTAVALFEAVRQRVFL